MLKCSPPLLASLIKQEAVDVAVQLKYDRIREESTTANQQFLDSIDDGMKKIIKEQVKKGKSPNYSKVEKFVTDQLESEVLVRSSKEANTSHAVAANLSELELKKILIDKMEANNSINRSDIQRQLYKALVEAYEADKILPGGPPKEEGQKGTRFYRALSERQSKTAGKTTGTGSKTHKKSASQSAPVGELCQSYTDVFDGPADRSSKKQVLQMNSRRRGKSTKPHRKLDWINPEGRQYPHDLRQPLPLRDSFAIIPDWIRYACNGADLPSPRAI
ncbi:hypothetical protein Tco_0683063 [Tanacetum coccineum]|uniref:Uncharacterized protein n=1 Tax=Tanacetum coccineum TaxID=301880 RepID=A0ABQ4XUC7_9ASTR